MSKENRISQSRAYIQLLTEDDLHLPDVGHLRIQIAAVHPKTAGICLQVK
jgi:hypothetical protein